jgi:hypothetical protein
VTHRASRYTRSHSGDCRGPISGGRTRGFGMAVVGGWVSGEGLEGLTSLKAKRIEKVATVWCSIKCHPRNPGKKEEQQQLSVLSKRGTWKAERGTWINLRPGGNGSGGRWRCWKRQTNWPHEGIRDSRPQCRRSHVARNHHGQPWKESLGRAQSPIFEV